MYEGLKFSHVKFYHDISAVFNNLPRKPQNFGDNWPLASNSFSLLQNDIHYKLGVKKGGGRLTPPLNPPLAP